jgi:hypothetical protein
MKKNISVARRRWLALSTTMTACALSAAMASMTSTASAADPAKPDYVPDIEKPPAAPPKDEKKPEGFEPRLTAGATLSLIDMRSVVGQTDGLTVNFGIKFDAGLDYRRGKHEWRSSLTMGEGLTRTPVLGEFVKSKDDLFIESIYLFHVLPWVGPFARASLQTSMFRGSDVRPAPTTYLILDENGATRAIVGKQLSLSDPFRPLTLKQSLGAFIQPVAHEKLNVEVRLGGGARETLADEQLAVSDDDKTPEIEVKELVNVYQAGVELNASAWGDLLDKRVSYRVSAEVMTPLVYSDLPAGDQRGSIALTNIDFGATLSFKLVEWASLDYELKAIRQPQLIDKFQVQNSLLFTLGVALGADAPKK